MSYTPGPWRVKPDDAMEAHSLAIWTKYGRSISVRGIHRLENAALIAAAPDLLAALEAYHAQATDYHTTCGHGEPGSVAECDGICDCMAAAGNAIAKARGDAP